MKRLCFSVLSCLYTATLLAAPSRNFLENFYDEYIYEQKDYLASTQLTSQSPTGYVPFTIVNNSTYPDTEVYILILANNFTNIITFSANADGLLVGSSVTPPTKTYVSQSGSGTYPLSFFNNNGSYTFYIPSTVNLAASRIYYSIGQPLDWLIPISGPVLVPSQDFSDPTQDGYYILFDKQEFTMVANDRLVMNPTLVDYYGLPLSFSISYSSTTSYAGLPPTLSSTQIFANYAAAVGALPTSPNGGTQPIWNTLNLSYAPPSGSSSPLRILSPYQGLQTLSPVLTNPIFPINYFLSNNYTNCAWLTSVWANGTNNAIYQLQPLYVDLSVVGPSYGVAKGQVDTSGNFNFTAISGTGTGSTLVLPTPTSSRAFFTSTLSDYVPAPTMTGDPNVATAIWQALSAGIISGIVPLENTSQSSPLSQSYIRQQMLFSNNSNLSCMTPSLPFPPYYDFYSGTFIGMGSSPYTKFYTTPYADFLGTDGTITVTNIQNANAQVTISIGSMAGISVPNPFDDKNLYTVVFNELPSYVTVTFGPNPNFSSNPTVPFAGKTYMNVAGSTMYLGVTFTSGNYTGQVWGTQLIPSGPASKPVIPGGMKMELSGGPGGTLTITMNAPP